MGGRHSDQRPDTHLRHHLLTTMDHLLQQQQSAPGNSVLQPGDWDQRSIRHLRLLPQTVVLLLLPLLLVPLLRQRLLLMDTGSRVIVFITSNPPSKREAQMMTDEERKERQLNNKTTVRQFCQCFSFPFSDFSYKIRANKLSPHTNKFSLVNDCVVIHPISKETFCSRINFDKEYKNSTTQTTKQRASKTTTTAATTEDKHETTTKQNIRFRVTS